MSKRKLNEMEISCVCPAAAGRAPSLNEFRLNGVFCDATVHCADGAVRVHRAVLAAASPYFRAVFTDTLRRGARADTAVDARAALFGRVLDYAYTGACHISADSAQELLACADRLEVLGLVAACCHFLRRTLSPANCFRLLRFAQTYFCRDLERRARLYIRRNFERVLEESGELSSLSFEELRDMLADSELNVRSETTVFEVARDWVERAPAERKGYAPELLACVRFSQLDSEFFAAKVLRWKYVSEYKMAARLQDLRRTPRPRIPHELLFAIGGWSSSSPTSYVETYDVRADSWLQCAHTDSMPRAYHGVCALGRLVYVIGGFDGSSHFNTVHSFDPVARTWAERACMYQARCYVSVATHDGMIYALGGYNGVARLRSVERYCPRQNQWEMLTSMNMVRSDAGATAFGGKIYIVGGINGEEVLRCGEVFDPSCAQWTFLPPLGGPRSGVSLLALGDCLYALGGFDGSRRLNTCERLNPAQTLRWEQVASLLTRRSNFATAILDEAIFVIGGYNGAMTIASVERYDARRDEWRGTAPMTLNRSALACCVLAGLPNARHYRAGGVTLPKAPSNRP